MVVSPQHLHQLTNGYEKSSYGLWTHHGRFVVTSGPVDLPDGSIGTSEIAPNACQQLISSYVQATAWSLPQTNVWTETPIAVTLTFGGYQTRIEFNVPLVCATKGQHLAWGIMVDGVAPSQGPVGALDAPENGYGMMAVGVYYFVPTPTSHRFAFGLYGPNGSSIPNSLPSTLYVTEQRR